MSDQQTPDEREPEHEPEVVPDLTSAPPSEPAREPESDPMAALGDLLGGGAGGFDMNALLEQAQAMQSSIVTAQEELAAASVEGSVGGGAVSVTVNGLGEMKAVDIRAGSFDGADADSLADLGDLVVAAYRDAKARADALASQKLGPMTGGLGGDPGGFGGPGGAPGGSGLGFTR